VTQPGFEAGQGTDGPQHNLVRTGLRIADSWVMPEHVTVNPNLTVMMIGERCADLIRASQTLQTTTADANISASLV
jgi:choline oxidase